MKKIMSPYLFAKYTKLVVFLFLVWIIQSCDPNEPSSREGGFQGVVSFKGNNQAPIQGAIVTFSKSDEENVTVAETDAQGAYKVTLKPGTYHVTVTSFGFNSYTASELLNVTDKSGYQPEDFFVDTEIASGFWGVVWDINNNSISTATGITFSSSSNPFLVYSTYSKNGSYKMNVPLGSYYVRAVATGYRVYDTTPGLFVVNGSNYQTGNIFLTPQ